MGADQSTNKPTKISKDDMSPYMHPIGERTTEKEGILGFRSKLQSVGAARSGSVSSVNSPNASGPTSLKENKFNRAFSTSFSSLPTSHSRDIVIVNEGKVSEDDFDYEKELEKLKRIPRVTPLYRNRNLSSSFDHKSAFHFCARYHEHLKQCAEAVTFDQSSLAVRLKEVETESSGLEEKIRERQRKQTRQLEQVQRFNQIQETARKVVSLISKFEDDLNDLNSQLPVGHQLEPFSFSPSVANKTSTSQNSIVVK